MSEGEKKPPLTFWTKETFRCPVCSNEVKQEKLLSGGGRLIAGDLTRELRRLYVPSKKFGKVWPLIYPVLVCPKCFFASFPEDFQAKLLGKVGVERARMDTQRRKELILKILGPVDFSKNRSLKSGTASYILSFSCYDYYPPKIAPTFKKALSALRAAWLLGDLVEEEPEKAPHYKLYQDFFYKRALELYKRALDKETSGEERLEVVKNLGPDVDHNWGYPGVCFMVGSLTLKLAPKLAKTPAEELALYEEAKKYLRIAFGDGKMDRQKPGPLLDMTRDMYRELNERMEKLQNAGGGAEASG